MTTAAPEGKQSLREKSKHLYTAKETAATNAWKRFGMSTRTVLGHRLPGDFS